MIKRLLTIVLAVFCLGMSAFAGSKVSVIQGDPGVLKTFEGGILLEINVGDATFDNKMPLDEKYENLDDFINAAYEGFSENLKLKSGYFTKKTERAKYKVTIDVENVDKYFKVSVIPSPATKIWGTVSITNIETGEELVTIKFDEVDGGANPSPDGTISDAFKELAHQIKDIKVKKK